MTHHNLNAREIIDQIGEKQGWDDHSKLNLLCRFIENVVENPTRLSQWLKNQADWENDGGLNAGREQ